MTQVLLLQNTLGDKAGGLFSAPLYDLLCDVSLNTHCSVFTWDPVDCVGTQT